MVDYNTNVPAIQPMQQPNMMQAYGQMQQIQANRMLMQDRERAQQESERFRELLRSGVDASTPEGRRALSVAAPTLGPAYSASDIASKKAVLDIDIAKATKARGLVEDMVNRIPGVLTAQRPEDAYADLVKFADANLGEGQHNLPRQWPGRAALYGIASKGAAFVEQNKPQVIDDNGQKVLYDPITKTKTLIPEAGATAQPNRFGDVGQGTPAASVPLMNPELTAGTQPPAVQSGAAIPAQGVNRLAAIVGTPAPVGNTMAGGPFGGLPALASVPALSPIAQAQAEAQQRKVANEAALAGAREQGKTAPKKAEGKTNVGATLTTMAEIYDELNRLGGLPSETKNVIENVPAYLAGTSVGQELGKAAGTKTQTQRNRLDAVVRTLMSDIKNATGMTASEVNSIPEMQLLKNAVTKPTQSIESIRDTIQFLNKRYGSGEAIQFRTVPSASSSGETSGVPAGRRGAAPAAAATPSAMPSAAVARLKANPSEAAQFDEIFGAGAAAKVLGR